MKISPFRLPCHLLSGLAFATASCAVSAQDFTVARLPQANVDAPISFYGYTNSNGVVSNPVDGSVDNANFTPAEMPPLNLGTFDIVIAPGVGLTSNPAALAAFNRAAAAWEARISDPITITINADLGALGAGIIGSTSSVTLQAGYNIIRDQVVADAAGHPNEAIVGALPTAAQFTAIVPAGKSLSGNVLGTKAQLKAAGFAGLDAGFGASDASITFSTNFSFDFDRSNGFTPGTIDFETVAEHEIGHALGFFSFVDSVDAGAASISPSILDLFRFSRNVAGQDPTSVSDFTNFARNYVPGADTNTDDTTNAFRMSTGVSLGDGRQASHWKADELTGEYVGIMDPTLANETAELATDADFRAFDLIGYDVVPEPTALGALLMGGIGLVGIRRARRR